MRLILTLLFLAAMPAHAWQATTDGRLCVLTHSEAQGDVRLTYDPAGPAYSITLRRPAPWPDAPVLALRFDGPRGLTSTTDRHVMADANTSLTVTDRGFGNVLNGLEFNDEATALIGDQTTRFSLKGAAPEVRIFRDCTVAGLV